LDVTIAGSSPKGWSAGQVGRHVKWWRENGTDDGDLSCTGGDSQGTFIFRGRWSSSYSYAVADEAGLSN